MGEYKLIDRVYERAFAADVFHSVCLHPDVLIKNGEGVFGIKFSHASGEEWHSLATQ